MQKNQRRYSSDHSGPEVLIIGAGPVGLLLGCELARQGVAIRVIDRQRGDEGPGGSHSRAILIWPRVLEQLRRTGVSARLVEAGHVLPAVDYFTEGRLRGRVRIDKLTDTAYPFILTLAQNETETILKDRLRELGGAVEYGTAVEGIDNGDGTGAELPKVTLRLPGGETETVVPAYVVGADGAASPTRRLLGVEFAQHPIDVSYGIGDFPITGPIPHSVQYYYSGKGIAVVVPLANGLFRIAANIGHRSDADGPPPPELFQEFLDQRAKLPVKLGAPAWTSSFRPRCGVIEQYRTGRCFLAGDAAHVVSPAGGQGMNLGLLDAVDLGWKLGGVLRHRLHAKVLDTYHPERSAAAKRVVDTSATQIKFGQLRGRGKVVLRNLLFTAAYRVGLLQRLFAPLLAQTDFSYRPGAPAGFQSHREREVVVGDRVPLFAPPVAVASLPALDLDLHTVLLWPGTRTGPDWPAVQAGLRDRLEPHAAVADLSTVFGRSARTLRKAFGAKPAIFAVRPDGHLLYRGAPETADTLVSLLRAPEPAAIPPVVVPAPQASSVQIKERG
ncbi:MAG: hypothetical protein JWQ81_2786 [Amycolatopsis sp.]|jgi:2-polyprenyl-6-methoxyphenol hydroxylase-like FAD-dependent oxidoreductase|uniref:FAD-dependent monooxygenase n=1 Tax=Amycolatopsis sp. TaxID=37632 RepID=UPI0026365AF4|nr:FAD-dependent monooxygenase [Amycolatopsis sp.]MCU1682047.1 hypothetical protein [Amycolatopsis sp.]